MSNASKLSIKKISSIFEDGVKRAVLWESIKEREFKDIPFLAKEDFGFKVDIMIDGTKEYKNNKHEPCIWFCNGKGDMDFLPMVLCSEPYIPYPFVQNITDDELLWVYEFVRKHHLVLLKHANDKISSKDLFKHIDYSQVNENEDKTGNKIGTNTTGLTRYIWVGPYDKSRHYLRIKIQTPKLSGISEEWASLSIPDLKIGSGRGEYDLSGNEEFATKRFSMFNNAVLDDFANNRIGYKTLAERLFKVDDFFDISSIFRKDIVSATNDIRAFLQVKRFESYSDYEQRTESVDKALSVAELEIELKKLGFNSWQIKSDKNRVAILYVDIAENTDVIKAKMESYGWKYANISDAFVIHQTSCRIMTFDQLSVLSPMHVGELKVLDDQEEIEMYSTLVWDMLEKTYENIGGLQTFRNYNDFKKKKHRMMVVRDFNSGELLACATYRRIDGGIRISAFGYNQEDKGKLALQQIVQHTISEFGLHYWTEVSGAIEHCFRKYNVYPMPNTMAGKILQVLDEKITLSKKDLLHYDRPIGPCGEVYTKMIFGIKSEEVFQEAMASIECSYDFISEVNKMDNESKEKNYSVKQAIYIIENLYRMHEENAVNELTPNWNEALSESMRTLKSVKERTQTIDDYIEYGKYLLSDMQVLTLNVLQ